MEYVGSCKDIGNRNHPIYDIFRDATEFAQALEEGKKMSKKEFVSNGGLPHHIGKNFIYLKLPRGVVVAYDKDTDVHYIYVVD